MIVRSHSLGSAAILVVVALVGPAGCGGSATEDGSGGSACRHGGKTYDVGDSFPAEDGCNTCTCEKGGGVACTQIGCVGSCLYDGSSYAVGEQFPAKDGCNTCECRPDGDVVCTEEACEEGCMHDGMFYPVGASFPAGDGCNTCECLDAGSVSCTLAVCADTCTYAGKEYQHGEQFPSLDGCNTCTCDNGGVSCTEINCPCDPQSEWYRDYIGMSPMECAVIDYACPENTTAFSNSCGCGCEQDSSCPQWFNCMPPSPCNVDEIKKTCPYSGIAL